MPDYPKSLFKNLGGNWTERLARNATEEKELLATGYASMAGESAASSPAASPSASPNTSPSDFEPDSETAPRFTKKDKK